MAQICTLDFETFYDREFSLSKITTEEYVRDPRFQVIGCAFKWGDGPVEWIAGPDAVADYIRSVDWADTAIVCQNTMFDGFILTYHYGVQPKAWIDTMGMSRALFPHEKSHSLKSQADRLGGIGAKGDEVLNALGKRYEDFTPEQLEKYGEYCINDVFLTYQLFLSYIGRGFPKNELRLIDLTLRMYVDPVLELDRELLAKHLAEVRARKLELLERVRDHMLQGMDPEAVRAVFAEGTDGIKRLLMSNAKFADMLRSFGVEPPMKISPTTGKLTFAFAKSDEEFKALEDHHNPEVQALVAARLGNRSTLEESRTERFIGMAARGKFPVPLRYYGAHSGRWSGEQSVNLQNLPSRGSNAGKIKKAITPPEGHVIIDCDSAQIEARVLAWLAGQEDLVQAFREKRDVYKLMASKIYGVPVEEITSMQRQVGKTVVLGAGYGVGHVKLQAFLKVQAGVEVSLAEAKRIIDTYRQASDKISDLWSRASTAIRYLIQGQSYEIDSVGLCTAVPGKGITLPSGLYIQYPELRSATNAEGKQEFVYTSKGLPVRIYGGKCLAADTEVLTRRGWIPITDVQQSDRVWDGVEWVEHSGLTYQGDKSTIVLNGVRMTPDHKVLTAEGWRDASSCEGLHGADFWLPDGAQIQGSETAFHLGVPMRMWEASGANGNRRGEVREAGRKSILRMHGGRKEHYPRANKAPGVLGMEVNEGSLPAPITSGVEQLRRAGHHGMRSMGQVVRRLLVRYGANVLAGTYAGQDRQQRRLLPGELSVGFVRSASREPARGATSGHDKGSDANWDCALNAPVPLAPEPVYDILNAGPRSRFVVRGNAGPFIVHNCVENICQAVARQVVAEQMLRIAKRYKVVLTVHDAVAAIAPVAQAKEAQAYVEECMRWNPPWATGLPLSCESGMGLSYGDC